MTVNMEAHCNALLAFLREKEQYLRENLDVKGILHSEALRDVFTEEERDLILNRDLSNNVRAYLFLQRLFIKGGHDLMTFVHVLEEKYADSEVLLQWRDLQALTECSKTQGIITPDAVTDTLTVTHQSPAIVYDEAQPFSADSTTDEGFPFKGLRQNSQTDVKYPPEPGTLSKEFYDAPSDLINQIVGMISHLACVHESELGDLQNQLNNALCDQKGFKQSSKRLAEILITMTTDGRLQYHTVMQVLNNLGMPDTAAKLSKVMQDTIQGQHIEDLPFSIRNKLTQALSVATTDGKDWHLLPELLDIRDINIDFIEQSKSDPAAEILKIWKKRRCATVGTLYRILCNNGFDKAASILESELDIKY